MSDDAGKFDPRFDPAFQRGFDGPTRAVAREKLQPTSAVAPSVAITSPPPARAAEPDAVDRVAEGASGQQRIVVEPTDYLDDEPTGRRLNPFLIALVAAAVVLIGGGLYLTSRLGELFANPGESSQYDYITLQVMTIAAPMLIVLGIATGVGVLFIYAVRWGRS